jgi:hypothetical protein
VTVVNGHEIERISDQDGLDRPPAPVPAALGRSDRVLELQQQLTDATAEQGILHDLDRVFGDEVFRTTLSRAELDADREVDEKIRAMKRADRLRAARVQVHGDRRARRHQRWDARAERVRDRILDPARALGTDHRRWVLSTLALGLLLAGGVTFMAVTVHHGIFGVDGSWTGYLIEPLASVLLAVSMGAQFTARMRGVNVHGGFVAFDVALAVASLLLNIVPWGARFGWKASDVLIHTLAPLLVIGAVVGWHLASRLYSEALAVSANDEGTQQKLALLRAAIAAGALPVNPSAIAVVKFLREHLPNGIGHQEGRRVARMLLGY